MKVKVIETGEFNELRIIDDKTGSCFAMEVIGGFDAFSDGQFTKAFKDGLECDYYDCNQETLNWWVDYFNILEVNRENVRWSNN